MNFLSLTNWDGFPVIVNMKEILYIFKDGARSDVYMKDSRIITVQETTFEIYQLMGELK